MACVRVKRNLSEEPVDAILVSHKRRRVQEENAEEIKTVFRYVCTVVSKDEPIKEKLLKAIHLDKYKDTYRRNVKAHTPAVVSKLKESIKLESKENRYRLVNTRRGMCEIQLEESKTAELENTVKEFCKLYDAEEYTAPQTNLKKIKKEEVITCNGEPMTSAECCDKTLSDHQYVYDLYYINVEAAASFPDEPVRIEFWDAASEQMYDNDNEDVDEDDSDSNDENHWKNDYPEEDSDFEKDYDYYGGYEDITDRVANIGFEDNDESYLNDSEDSEDVRLHGKTYADYKKSILKYMVGQADEDESEEDVNGKILMKAKSGNPYK